VAVVPDELVWGGDYGFYTGTSGELVQYFRRYSEWALDYFWPLATPLVVEIGCNDGTLLHHFARHAKVVGVDPAAGPAEVARTKGMNVITDSFGMRVAGKIIGEYGQAGLVIANNVAAHVSDLDDFFAGLAALLAPGGAAVVEVQYLPDLLAGNGVDLVYHEHRSFFSGTSLARVAERHDLRWLNHTFQPTQGGSIRVVLNRGHDGRPSVAETGLRKSEEWLWDLAVGDTLQGRADRVKTRLRDTVGELLNAGLTIAGYGAPAKATTLFHWAGLDVEQVRWVEDTTPGKIGRYLPGTRVPIVSPESGPHPDVYLLTIHNYARGVIAKELEFMKAGGRFLLPLPMPQVI